MTKGALTAFITDYIAMRRQAKLDAFDKASVRQIAEGLEDDLTIREKRQALEQRYETRNWLTEAASRAGQISLVTHAAKYTHGDSRSSSVFSVTTANDGYVSTSTLENPPADAVGNAATLDVAKLLQSEVEGDSLLACLKRGDYCPFEPLAQDANQLRQWTDGFSQALTTREPASHKLAKQIYFPVGDGYHLLSPLFATSLAQALYQKLVTSRFSDEAKAIWQARRNNQWHDKPLIQFMETAEMHFGGTKPQNISSLNSGRGGRVWLLSAQPPRWKRQEKPPENITSVFAIGGAFDRAANSAIRRITALLTGSGEYRNRNIREARDRYVDELIDLLFVQAGDVQRVEWQGWSQKCERPARHQQLWLDPWRSLQDDAFRLERDLGNWQDAVAEDFARWLNYRLRKAFPDVGKADKREWESRPLFRQRLREMESILREALK